MGVPHCTWFMQCGDQTQSLTCARQALYQLSYISGPSMVILNLVKSIMNTETITTTKRKGEHSRHGLTQRKSLEVQVRGTQAHRFLLIQRGLTQEKKSLEF